MSWDDQIKEDEMSRVCSTCGRYENVLQILIGIPEGKRPLGRTRHRWEDNIKMYLTEIGWEGVDWIHLAQDRDQWQALVDMVVRNL